MSLISQFESSSPLLSFALTPSEISGVAHAAPLHIFYGPKFGFMYPFKLRTLLKNIIIASASVGSAFDPSSSFKTIMMAAFKAPLLLVSSTHRAQGDAQMSATASRFLTA
jgi:Sec-independent protein secretion pathway component TatC